MATDFRYENLPVFDAFERVSDPSVYTPLPDDWQVGVADVVDSTEASRQGRYKAVNMAGAAAVSAVRNALSGASFPFVFGGDGAVLAVPPEAAEATRRAMAATARFVRDELGLQLRVGMIPVQRIRAAGHDLSVARYAASSEAIYAMFSGGGASYAEAELKAGRLAIAEAEPGARADLTGLSCRWSPIRSRHGMILTILVAPAAGASPAEFRRVATDVIRITQGETKGGHPVPGEGPEFAIEPASLMLEATATSKSLLGRPVQLAKFAGEMVLAIGLDRAGRSLAHFNPKRYRRWVARNSDYRKYDDALRMTIDCSAETAQRIEAVLTDAESRRIVDYGTHRQDAAIMTCIVPSYVADDHVHFLDGADGGYALAAQALKQKAEARSADQVSAS